MQPSFSFLTVCGLEELEGHASGGVTHVLSILDPEWPDPEVFAGFGDPRRLTLRFHDCIEPGPGIVLPERRDIDAILDFGAAVAADERRGEDDHLLVHCHMGISRSTAAMATLLVQTDPGADDAAVIARLHAIREKAWPNARMIAFADEALGRGGKLSAAVTALHALQLTVRPKLGETMRGLGRGREVDAAERYAAAHPDLVPAA